MMKAQQVKTIEDLVQHFADHGEVIHLSLIHI